MELRAVETLAAHYHEAGQGDVGIQRESGGIVSNHPGADQYLLNNFGKEIHKAGRGLLQPGNEMVQPDAFNVFIDITG